MKGDKWYKSKRKRIWGIKLRMFTISRPPKRCPYSVRGHMAIWCNQLFITSMRITYFNDRNVLQNSLRYTLKCNLYGAEAMTKSHQQCFNLLELIQISSGVLSWPIRICTSVLITDEAKLSVQQNVIQFDNAYWASDIIATFEIEFIFINFINATKH